VSVWVFLATCAGALVLGSILLRRVLPRTGSSYEDWLGAEPLGGRWARAISIASGIAAAVGIIGFGAPGWLRAALLGMLAGFCLPFALEGIRRALRGA
jgi:hypothetical protein